MSGLFGGDDSPPPAPTRSPKGVRINKTAGAGSTGDTILGRSMAANAGPQPGMTLLDDGQQRDRLGGYGGNEGRL